MMNAAANLAEKVIGHRDTTSTGGVPSNGETMWALAWHGKHDVRYERTPKPIVVDPQDVVIRITATTICGSDLHVYDGQVPNVHDGQTQGHESMGIIDSVGPGVKTLKVGDRVVHSFDMACGTCAYCQRKEYTGCENTNPSKLNEKFWGHAFATILGWSSLSGGYGGCQAEYVRIPFADVNCLKVPDNVPDEKALYLSDIACTSYHAAVELGQVKKGEKVAIWGAGPIGILVAKWCEIFGASQIIVVENDENRMAVLKKAVPIAQFVNFDKEDVCDTIAKLCPGGPDVVIECAGFRFAKSMLHKVERAVGLETDTSELVNECIRSVRKYGRMVLIADYSLFTNHFNIGGMMEKHLFVSGGQCPVQEMWHTVLDFIQKGTFDPTICVTHYGKLSDGPQFYKDMNQHNNGVIKTFLRPDHE